MSQAGLTGAGTANIGLMRSKNSKRARGLTLAAMSLGFGVVQLDITIVNTALITIAGSLGGAVSDLQWVVNTYTIGFAALILTAGALGDRVGAKRIFMAGFALFTAASLACAMAPDSTILIAARAVQGIGAAVLVPNSLALLNHAYPEERQRGWAVGIWAAGASLALTAGPLAGGGLIALVGWRSIFLVNLPIGLLGMLLTWRYANETPRVPARTIDVAGQVLVIGALGCVAGAMIEAGTLGWRNRWVLAGFAAFAVLATGFLINERRALQPMLPLELFKRRMFTLTSIVGLLANAAFYGLIFVLSLYFQQIQGRSPLRTGLAFLPLMGMVLPMNLLAARIAQRWGAPATIATGAVIAAVGCLTLIGIGPMSAYRDLCAQLIAIGAGLGLLVPPLTSALLGSVEKARSGLAAGVLNSTRQTGSVLGVALFGSLVAQKTEFMVGVRISLIISAVLFSFAAAAISMGAYAKSEAEMKN
jgi:MFS transporter, DHA2 family, methylenomycin A resistance protein